MAFYENTIIARQDLAENALDDIKNKYTGLIDATSGKVIKIEMWGLLNFAKKIKKHNRGFYIHYKFEGNNKTISEIRNKIKNDNSIIRNLIVKYKKLDTKNEFFKKTK
jgi:small subunit ribosomal protein S6